MKRYNKRYLTYSKAPTCKQDIIVGDIWYASVPFRELGNYEKFRPVYIKEIKDSDIICYKITSKPKGKLITTTKKVNSKLLYKNSYLTNELVVLKEDKFYSRIMVRWQYKIEGE